MGIADKKPQRLRLWQNGVEFMQMMIRRRLTASDCGDNTHFIPIAEWGFGIV